MPSGNATHPFFAEKTRDVTFHELIDRAAVVLIARVPLKGNLYQDTDNIQLEMVCVKPERLGGEPSEDEGTGDDNEEPDGEPDRAGRLTSTCWVTVAAAVMTVAISL